VPKLHLDFDGCIWSCKVDFCGHPVDLIEAWLAACPFN
jgi:hypothetical protein